VRLPGGKEALLIGDDELNFKLLKDVETRLINYFEAHPKFNLAAQISFSACPAPEFMVAELVHMCTVISSWVVRTLEIHPSPSLGL
jgi:hypothetical protein